MNQSSSPPPLALRRTLGIHHYAITAQEMIANNRVWAEVARHYSPPAVSGELPMKAHKLLGKNYTTDVWFLSRDSLANTSNFQIIHMEFRHGKFGYTVEKFSLI